MPMLHHSSNAERAQPYTYDAVRLERDDFSSNRHPALALCLSMSFFAKPVPTFAGHAVGDALPLAIASCAGKIVRKRAVRRARVRLGSAGGRCGRLGNTSPKGRSATPALSRGSRVG